MGRSLEQCGEPGTNGASSKNNNGFTTLKPFSRMPNRILACNGFGSRSCPSLSFEMQTESGGFEVAVLRTRKVTIIVGFLESQMDGQSQALHS